MRAGVACLLLALAASLLGCGEDKDVPAPATDSPTAELTEVRPSALITPNVTPVVTMGPATHIDPVYAYSYEVPSGWFVYESVDGYSALTSYDPRTAPQRGFGCDEQTGVIKVEFYVEESPREFNS